MKDNHNCKDLVSAISDYVDGSLRDELCVELEKHLHDCENCKIVVNTLKKTIEIVQEQKEDEHIPDDVRSRLFYQLNLAEFEQKSES